MRRFLLAVVLLFLVWLGPLPARPVFAFQEPTNLLKNPSFEGAYYPWLGLGTAQVAHEWTPWWRARTDADPPAYYFQPEFKQANGYIYPNRVHNGPAAQQWFTFHATHQAGMYQQVFGVTPGTRYRFTIWAQVWSSTEDDPSTSVNPAYPNLQVGIDPTGNWDPWGGTVMWSGTYAPYDGWGRLVMEAVAQNDVITVFMRSNPNFPVKHNDMYWDDASLIAVGGNGAPAPPTATAAGPPPATTTPGAPPPPTPTCAPAPSSWVKYSVRRGDTLFSLSRRSGTTVERVVSVNCLKTTNILVGQVLLLPKTPATATPPLVVATATLAATPPATATASRTLTKTPTVTASATATEASATLTSTAPPPTTSKSPTALPPTEEPVTATATAVPIAAATVTPTKPRATLAPPATSTPGSPEPPPTPASSGESTRPCGTIVVGAGFVLVAGVFRFRRRGIPI